MLRSTRQCRMLKSATLATPSPLYGAPTPRGHDRTQSMEALLSRNYTYLSSFHLSVASQVVHHGIAGGIMLHGDK